MPLHHSLENLATAPNNDERVCIICARTLDVDDLTAASPCNHRFHHQCIRDHLAATNSCPTCNQPCTVQQLSVSNNNLLAELADAEQRSDLGRAPNEYDAGEGSSSLITNRGRNRNDPRRGRSSGQRRGMVTRSQQRGNAAQQRDRSANTPSGFNSSRAESVEEIGRVVQEAMQSQQQKLMQDLTVFVQSQIANLQLEQNTQSPRRSMNNMTQRTGLTADQTQPGPRLNLPVRDQHDRVVNRQPSQNSERSHTSVQPEKVPGIIQSWHVKFDGAKDGLQTEDFLYRVQALARQNLNGDHQLLSDHLHLFFTGKANEWYWKFHQSCAHFTWAEFCREFRQKFRDVDTDMDIWESINNRRQADREPFEEYQFQIEKLVSRLSTRISEKSLVELLIRHAKPSLRYELMHLRINSLVTLREEIRTHEQFCKQNRPQQGKNQFATRPYIAQLEKESEDVGIEDVSALQPSQIKCWNCDKFGHRFDECLEVRSIFCYGCGAKNTFKPNCQHCRPSENRQRDASTRIHASHPKH